MMTSLNSSQQSQKTSVILSDSSDWDEWIEVIKTAALSGKVWDLIDPNTSKNEISQLVEPQAPKPAEVDPLKANFSDLNEGLW